MAKDLKTRKGKDNIYYPYTSPDIVIDDTGESQTVKNNIRYMQKQDHI